MIRHTHIITYIYIYKLRVVSLHTYIHIHIHVYTHTCIYTYMMYIHIHVYTHTDIFRQGADRLAEQVEDLKSKVGEIENLGEAVGQNKRKVWGQKMWKRCETTSGTIFLELFFWNHFVELLFFAWEYRESCEGWEGSDGLIVVDFLPQMFFESCCRTSFSYFFAG